MGIGDLMKYSSDSVIKDIKTKDNKGNDKEMDGMNKFEKLKNMFSEGIFEEVKEENEGEGSDTENEIKVKDDKLKDLKDNKNKNPDEKGNLKEKKEEYEIDEKILESVNERMDLLMKLIDDPYADYEAAYHKIASCASLRSTYNTAC